ncbi:hypothetical protein IAT38_000174 [Cryptococcus sp. DSM 104549]
MSSNNNSTTAPYINYLRQLASQQPTSSPALTTRASSTAPLSDITDPAALTASDWSSRLNTQYRTLGSYNFRLRGSRAHRMTSVGRRESAPSAGRAWWGR